MDKPISAEVRRRANGAWFKAKRNSLKLSAREVAEKLGMVQVTLSAMENRGGTYDLVAGRAKELGWDIPTEEAILGQYAAAAADDRSKMHTLNYLQISSDTKMEARNENEGQLDVPLDWVRLQYPHADISALALCKAPDATLAPTVKPNDILLADTSQTEVVGDSIYVFSFNGAVFIKKIVRQLDNTLRVLLDGTKSGESFDIGAEALEQFKVHAKILGKWVGFERIA